MKTRFSTRYLLLVAIGALALASLLFVATASASGPPLIEEESVSGITSTNATLEARINPNGFRAHYQFQLVTDPDEYASEILCPEPPRSLGFCIGEYAEGVLSIGFIFKEVTTVSLDLSSEGVTLQPGTTYHYRVLAARAIPSEDTIEWITPIVYGADQTFTTLSETPAGPPLTLKVEEGEGTVVSNPAGLHCTGAGGHECTTEEIEAGSVTLTASPASGYLLKSWKGCGSVEGRKCHLTLGSEAKTVGVKFTPAHSVTIEKAGNGLGSLSGVTCSYTCTKATAAFANTKAVKLKAKAASTADFTGWSGDVPAACEVGAPETCELPAGGTTDATVLTTFTEKDKEAVTLTKTGNGQGAVKSSPAGINCSYTCSSNAAYFHKGTTVTLTASVQSGTGSELGEWGGACSGSEASPCVLSSIGEAKSVTAEFK
jgi:hypothetical protein